MAIQLCKTDQALLDVMVMHLANEQAAQQVTLNPIEACDSNPYELTNQPKEAPEEPEPPTLREAMSVIHEERAPGAIIDVCCRAFGCKGWRFAINGWLYRYCFRHAEVIGDPRHGNFGLTLHV